MRQLTQRSLAGPMRARGATLIEVLVSIVIVAFGLLAMMAMQSVAIKFNKTSEFRSLATLLANDLGDRMKANRDGAVANAYDKKDAYAAMDSAPDRDACPTPDNCSAAELAAQDLSEWRRSLYFSLPASDAYVAYDAANTSVDLWLAWKDPTSSTDASTVADNGDVKECPDDFVASDADDPPRCMYFRIALPPPLDR